jgi:SAM-dependent methyltransferase
MLTRDGRLFRDDAGLSKLEAGIYSALPASAAGAAYDRKAAIYDAIVGRSIYHRIVWGTTTRRYSEFGCTALAAAGSEPFLEIGCGSLLFTREMYRVPAAGARVISDRSAAMLRRAVKRLGPAVHADRPPIVLHADAASLPLISGAFGSILMLNVLHVPCDRHAILAECARLLIPGRGRLFATCLGRSGRWSDAAIEFFYRAGELGVPLTHDEISTMVTDRWGAIESCRVEGNMVFAVVRHRG